MAEATSPTEGSLEALSPSLLSNTGVADFPSVEKPPRSVFSSAIVSAEGDCRSNAVGGVNDEEEEEM